MLTAPRRELLRAEYHEQTRNVVADKLRYDALEACQRHEHLIDPGTGFRQREFRRAVRQSVGEGYGFDPITMIIIAQLILTFLKLWFHFTRAEE